MKNNDLTDQNITQLIQKEEYDQVAAMMMQHIGDIKLNSTLSSDHSFIREFTYKTIGYENTLNVLKKINIAQAQSENGITNLESEKVSLSDIGKLTKLSSLQSQVCDVIAENTTNEAFKDFYSTLKNTENLIAELEQKALEDNQYKSGDLMMYLTSKTTALKERQNKLGHEGKLEENFVTKYNHAAPLYIDNDNKVLKSDVWAHQRIDALNLQEILESNALRIDPTKLVSPEYVKLLETIDYGTKKDQDGKDIPITWQETMQQRYEDLSYALHYSNPGNLTNAIITEYAELEVQKDEIENQKDEIESQLNELQTQENTLESSLAYLLETLGVDVENNPEVRSKYEKQINEIETNREDLEKQLNNFKEELKTLEDNLKRLDTEFEDAGKKLLENDQDRLGNASNWVSPKAIIEGHTSITNKNDMRELSQKMFNATPDQKKMICSEFSARSIASVVDQLNKLTAIDLQANELINKEEEIVKNPISKKERFDKLHPERLADILSKSGCIEKIENKNLKNLINLEDTNKGKTQNIDLGKNLSNKILECTKSSHELQDLKQDLDKIFKAYLSTQGVSEEKLSQIQNDKEYKDNLKNLYEAKNHEPQTLKEKVVKICTQVLEFLHLKEKDSHLKGVINKMQTGVENLVSSNQISSEVENEVKAALQKSQYSNAQNPERPAQSQPQTSKHKTGFARA